MNTQEQTQSMSSHRLGAHSYHEEPKQQHTESSDTGAVKTQEQTQSRSYRSVSRFQEKEKKGEMITKNDNIKW